ncbi:hypothetical protein [Roseateles sp. L2-2]|uniref:hypothetical protein n=1 Tax=Roseateles sp. L2-2 TaxID=3422597 RepID=UPI003D35DBFB
MQRIVQVRRRPPLDSVIGVLLVDAPGLVVVSEISGSLDPDGFCFLPRSDIVAIEEDFEHLDFHEAAASVWGRVESDIPGLDLQGGYFELMQSISREQTLIAVHPEATDPDICFVGTVRRVLSDRIGFTTLSSKGIWVPETQTIKIDEITKIELATRYLRSLQGVIAARSALGVSEAG